MLGTAAILLVVLRPAWPRGQVVPLLIFGILGLAAVQYTYFAAISLMGVALATFVQYLSLPLIALWEGLIGAERLGRRTIAAVGLAMVGTSLLLLASPHGNSGLRVSAAGLVFGLLSAVTAAFYTLYSVRIVTRVGPWRSNAWGFLAGGLAMSTLAPPWSVHPTGAGIEVAGLVAFVIVLGTLVPFALFLSSLTRISATEAGTAVTIEPVSAALASAMLLSAALVPLQYAGGAAIIAAVLLIRVAGGRAGPAGHTEVMTEPRHELPGSFRKAAPDARYVADVDPSDRIELTLVLRRRAELDPETIANGALSSAALAERFGADPADVDAVRTALAGIEILDVDLASRRVRVSGTAAQLADLFDARLTVVSSADPSTGAPVEHRQREGVLTIPASLAGVVVAVLGLDDRPQARAHLRVAGPFGAMAAAAPDAAGVAPAVRTSYTPLQLASLYSMPAGTDGSGQTLAIIELGGGFGASDLNTYFAGLNLPTPSVIAVGVDGATNVAGQDPSGADGEVLLDIEVAGAIAPRASIVVYFAPNTDAGFLDAVSTAAHAAPTPAAISISWGQSEDGWTGQARDAMDQAFADAAALGVTVTAASGDNGSNDRVADGLAHVDFPAASPHVLACGGTSLRADPSTGGITSETVWNDGATGGATGGGVSDTFPLPAWQANAHVPHSAGGGRGVPDVAADADPQTGYQVFVDGTAMVIGGTSAVAPLWAALVCRLAQSLGTPLGLIQPKLYAATSGFRDITQGNNGAFQAGPGWDACTGLGVPVGDALLTALRAGLNPPPP